MARGADADENDTLDKKWSKNARITDLLEGLKKPTAGVKVTFTNYSSAQGVCK
jgi:hypothetical protein